MSKQTAVQWFYKNLKNYKSLNLTDKLIQDLYKQAKQMEEEQIEEAFNIGEFEGVIRSDKRNSTDYYNETYGDKI